MIVGDIGGSNTRLAMVSSQGVITSSIRKYQNTGYQCFEDVYREYLSEFPDSDFHQACLGVASPVEGGVAKLTNLNWTISCDLLKEQFSLDSVVLLNDLEAFAYRVSEIDPLACSAVKGGVTSLIHSRAVMAIGTGLGVAICHKVGQSFYPLPTEAGHLSFSPVNSEHIQLFEFAQKTYPHVSWERLVSGRFGFQVLFDFYLSRSPELLTDTYTHEIRKHQDLGPFITSFAAEGDPVALKVVDLMLDLLAVHAGNIALFSLSKGGVFLSGSIVQNLMPFLNKRRFRKYFTMKGRYSQLLADIPVYYFDEDYAPLLGCHLALQARQKGGL